MSATVPQALSRDPGIWTLNISVVEEDESVALATYFLASWRTRKSDFLTVVDWWETAKSKIKGLTVTFCKNRVARLRSQRDLLVRLISYLKSQVDNGSASCVCPYQSALAELRKLDPEKLKESEFVPGLGGLRRLSAPQLICSGWRKSIAVGRYLRSTGI